MTLDALSMQYADSEPAEHRSELGRGVLELTHDRASPELRALPVLSLSLLAASPATARREEAETGLYADADSDDANARISLRRGAGAAS